MGKRVRVLAMVGALLAIASVVNPRVGDLDVAVRQPVVLSIAPDQVADCDNPDDPDNVEDVQVAGLCFFGDITEAYLTREADGSGSRVPMSNIVNIGANEFTATVPLAEVSFHGAPYFVFVVRGDGFRSTNFPNPFGFDVTFTCSVVGDPFGGPQLISCKVVRVSGGKFVLQVGGVGFIVNNTIVLLDGEPCLKNKYPAKFINPNDGTTTRINCSGGLKSRLPAVVTTRNSDGSISLNSLNCDFQ